MFIFLVSFAVPAVQVFEIPSQKQTARQSRSLHTNVCENQLPSGSGLTVVTLQFLDLIGPYPPFLFLVP
jgi:hypothetical protein